MNSLCQHCSDLFPIESDSAQGAVAHHPTVGALIESAQHCLLCDKIREVWLLENLQQRFPDLQGAGSDSLPLEFQVQHLQHCATGPSWFVLSGVISAQQHKFSTQFQITVTTHVSGGASLLSLSDTTPALKDFALI